MVGQVGIGYDFATGGGAAFTVFANYHYAFAGETSFSNAISPEPVIPTLAQVGAVIAVN